MIVALVQLDLFDNCNEIDELKMIKSEARRAIEIAEEAKESGDKVRKGLYAKTGELGKGFADLARRLDLLEKHLCQGV